MTPSNFRYLNFEPLLIEGLVAMRADCREARDNLASKLDAPLYDTLAERSLRLHGPGDEDQK